MGSLAPYFDADAYLAGLERPQVRIQNVTYTGRILSIEQWLPFEEELTALRGAAGDGVPETRAFAERVLSTWFPREDFPWYLGRRRDPVPALLEMPWPGLLALMRSFIQAQRSAIGLKPPPTPSPEPGPTSSS